MMFKCQILILITIAHTKENAIQWTWNNVVGWMCSSKHTNTIIP
jgi:hypothetical protein